ncbi:MAG: peptidylprolyl isomerase [Desulfatirhabdiaceae bacterium]|nr:peptidylprolyl isomerase [Desulfatirhabdiaceae bacterium]
MKRCKHVLTLAAVALMIQAGMAFPVMSEEKKTDVKPAAAKAKAGDKAATDKKAATQKNESSKKVAIVNGTPIVQADLDRGMEGVIQRKARSGAPMDEAQLKTIRMDVLNNLINRELLNQESKKQKIAITDADVNDRLSKIKQRFKDDAEFKEMLAKMKLTEAQIKGQLKEDLAIQTLIDKQVVEKISVTEQDGQAYYDTHPEAFKQPEQIKASHILVTVDPKDDPAKKAEALKKIESVQAKLKAGGDFAALAKELSDCPSKEKGGDLGYFGKGQMVKPFEDAALALKPGETSGIVETQFGYHIIKLAELKAEGIMPYADVKDQLLQYLKQEKIKAELDSYLAGLEKSSKIEKLITQ